MVHVSANEKAVSLNLHRYVVVFEPGPHGLAFGLWLTGEEHIGVFSDSRPTREIVRRLSKDKRVLNLFSYTGGFGVAASAGVGLYTLLNSGDT
jgi:23S rRNA G2069 N7-methylase RlmK/C1962 C5-methylase RlmI